MNYCGTDKLDITRKTGEDRALEVAPPWELVFDYKSGKISQKEYTDKYLQILDELNSTWYTEYLPSMSVDDCVTLVCYCPLRTFCHRVILAKWLHQKGIGEYCGEIK
jgi:uncharacterized protein YeaO (DUF488 family)